MIAQQDNNKGKQKLETNEISLTTPVTFVNSSDNMPKSIPEIGSTSKSEPSKMKSPEKKKVYTFMPVKPINNKSKNIGLLSKRQLKDKICEVSNKKKMPTPKRNRNGKMGINKETNYKFIPNAPRKTCFTCGNSNHLAIDCRESKKKVKTIPKSDIRNRSVFYKPEKSCFHCGSKWHSIYTCNEYHSLYHNFYEPLPKFNKNSNFGKSSVNIKKHFSSNPDIGKTNPDGQNPERKVFVRKTSAAKVDKMHVNRTQQVWVLKNSN